MNIAMFLNIFAVVLSTIAIFYQKWSNTVLTVERRLNNHMNGQDFRYIVPDQSETRNDPIEYRLTVTNVILERVKIRSIVWRPKGKVIVTLGANHVIGDRDIPKRRSIEFRDKGNAEVIDMGADGTIAMHRRISIGTVDPEHVRYCINQTLSEIVNSKYSEPKKTIDEDP